VPPRKKLLDISSGAGYPAFRIGRVRRRKLGQKIGRSIPAAVWDELIEATRDYRSDVDQERNTPPVSPTIDRVKKLRAAAAAIWDVHEERASDKLRTPYRHIRADKLYALALASRNMMRDCDAELGALARVEDSEFHAGEAWDWWIWRLTQILERAGLPTGARKDRDHDRVSPFVAFVFALQCCLPGKFRQHIHSEAALADGIIRARRRLSSALAVGAHNFDHVDL
jgi:hypothetical protein